MQGVVQEVGRRVGAADRVCGASASTSASTFSLTVTRPSDDLADVQDEVVLLLGVEHLEGEPLAADRAGVADLAAGLAVERRAIEDQDDRAAAVGLGRLGQPVLLEDADDPGRRLAVVA